MLEGGISRGALVIVLGSVPAFAYLWDLGLAPLVFDLLFAAVKISWG